MDKIFEKLYKDFREQQEGSAFMHTNDRMGYQKSTKDNIYRLCYEYAKSVNPIAQQSLSGSDSKEPAPKCSHCKDDSLEKLLYKPRLRELRNVNTSDKLKRCAE